MRIESVRFGVRTKKTLRKTGSKVVNIEQEILKHSTNDPKVKLYDGKFIQSHTYEKKDKNERKR